jgi:tRNA A37 N6-isopentenylltransferase MiaA
VEAQYGYGNGYYGRRSSAVPRTPEPEKKAEPMTAEEIVANEMPKLTEALELNEFEQAVVSSILTKYVQQSIELQLLKLDADKTREGMENIRENQKAELKAGLPEEKFNMLETLQKDGYKKKKGKKKKKKKSKT